MLKRAFLGGAACLFVSAVAAETVIADFESMPYPGKTDNFVHAGFRFSPSCHVDLTTSDIDGSTGLGFDVAGCDSWYNPNFLGPSEYQALGNDPWPEFAYLYVDRFGDPFSLLSIDPYIWDMDLLSSKGGYFDQEIYLEGREGPSSSYVMFSGPEWSGITWLLFRTRSGAPTGMDNLTVEVSSPGTVSLLALGLIGLLGLSFRGRTNTRVSNCPRI